MSVFEKLSQAKRLLASCKFANEDELHLCLQRIGKWHYAKNKKEITLSQMDASAYQILITNSLNPNTVYKWFLLAKSPLDIRLKLETRQLSQRDAFAEKKVVNTMANSSHQDLINDIMDCVNRYIVR